MSGLALPRPLDWLLILGPILVAVGIVALSEWTGEMLAENGPVELLQVAILASATLLFSRASGRLTGWAGLSVLGLACMALLFLVREMPRCDSPLHDFGPCFPGSLKTVGYFLPLLLAAVLLIVNPSLRYNRFGRAAFAQLPRFLLKLLPLLVLVPLILLAQLAEAAYWPIAEELLELVSYVIFVLFALRAAQAADAALAPPRPLERGDRQPQAFPSDG